MTAAFAAGTAVAAYCTNQITAHTVADLIAQGIGRLRHGHTRFDLLWTFWAIPWDLVRSLAHSIGRRLAWLPLVQFAWRIRIVVGTIAVILETQAGRWPLAIIIGAIIALSYVLRRSRSAWDYYLTAATGSRNKSAGSTGLNFHRRAESHVVSWTGFA